MRANASIDHESSMDTQVTTGSTVSRDGCVISYRRVGHGPAVLLVHGAMESSASHIELARALAGDFTVYAHDRRGRGMSGPSGPDYSMLKEVEDLDALLTHTGAEMVFGVSAGALILLQAALTLPAIRKAAIFEPPLYTSGAYPATLLARLDRDLARGDLAGALVTAMKGAQMGPAFLQVAPDWLLAALTKQMMASEEKKGSGEMVTMRALAPTLHNDFLLVNEMVGPVERFSAMRAAPLLLSGGKSPAYLRGSVDALASVFPHASRVVFPGLDHGASGPSDRGGKPERVARALRPFFA